MADMANRKRTRTRWRGLVGVGALFVSFLFLVMNVTDASLDSSDGQPPVSSIMDMPTSAIIGTPPTATSTPTNTPTNTPSFTRVFTFTRIPTFTPSNTVTGTPPTITSTPTTISPGSWTTQVPYPIPVLDEAVASQDGYLYSFSGVNINGSLTNSYKYDPNINTWTQIASLPSAREQASAVSDGQFIYILGGWDAAASGTATIYKYDPVSNSYDTTLPNFTVPTGAQAAAYLNGFIYKIAGFNTDYNGEVSTVEKYDIANRIWTTVAPYPRPVSFPMATSSGNSVYTAGGVIWPSFETYTAYTYNPTSNTWTALSNMPTSRWGSASDIRNGQWILAGGGVGGVVSSTVIRWDPTNNTWSYIDPMPQPRSRMAGATVGNSFYVVGGRDPSTPWAGTTTNQRFSPGLCIVTPLPTSLPNLWSGVSWAPTCPPTVLRLTTYSNSVPGQRSIGPSHMRLTSNSGDYRDFPVPGFYNQIYETYTYDCVVGSCIPDSWAFSLPFTLTADVYNEVFEFNECNNIASMNGSPPCLPDTPTPTPTPLPALAGHLTWQSISQPHTRNVGLTGTLTLCAASAPHTYIAATDDSGFFTVTTSLPDGTYDWRFKGPKWLAASGSLTISGGRSNPELGVQRAGDANNDNGIDSQDYVILKNTYGKPPGDPTYDPRGDFNNDGFCNVVDFNLIKLAFGMAGAPPICSGGL